MVTPSATSPSRSASGSGPLLFTPSPDTSITRRVPSHGQLASVAREKRSAPERLVHDMLARALAPIVADQAWASAAPAMRVQGTIRRCVSKGRPFDVGYCDRADHAVGDRRHHKRVDHRLPVALALQPRLLLVDRARDVDREHELQVDRTVRGTGGHGERAQSE